VGSGAKIDFVIILPPEPKNTDIGGIING